MCSALGSRTDPSSRSALGHVESSFADVWESPLANSVTSFPNATSSSVNQCTTRSVPPYNLGGTASVSGATCAMRIYPSPVMNMKWKPHFVAGIGKPHRERFRACEVPQRALILTHIFHIRALLMPSTPVRLLPWLPGQNDDAANASRVELLGRSDRSTETSASG